MKGAVAALATLLIAVSASGAGGILERYSLGASSHMQWALPARLLEISALAMTDDDRLLAIDDERAIVYELDYLDGGLVKAFALGDPVLRGDFEGLAALGGHVYLMTSEGEIYKAPEGQDGDRVDFERFKSKVDDECEFEGLGEDKAGNRLLLLCKDLKKKADIDRLAIYPWSLADEKVDQSARISLPLGDISMSLRLRRLHPSGLVVDDETGHMLLVAAREQALIELDSRGRFVDARRLPLNMRHPQAEGIELSRVGLLLSDEGGNSKARLSVYRADRMLPADESAE